ncbi:MAG: zinc ABC transporter substrate-binding protein [Melioribacteraceae bacterium]|nr:zinc ABC transporter substrate-binding protein [Melioribacteraceae bacterium]
MEENSDLTVAVTLAPYEYLINKIAGDNVKIITSLPPNATPHHFEPTARLIENISKADYYFRVGANLQFEEVWVNKLTDMNKSLKVIDLSRDLDDIDGDPHYWLSPQNLKIISAKIHSELLKAIPDQEEELNKNLNAFQDSLTSITAEIKNSLEEIPNKKLLVYHGSWSYFARDFGFEQLTIEQGSKEPTPSDLERILNEVKKSKIPVVFVDPQHSKTSAKIVAKELRVNVDTIDPLKKDILKNLIEVKNKIEKHYK